jgi:hypothetical protein
MYFKYRGYIIHSDDPRRIPTKYLVGGFFFTKGKKYIETKTLKEATEQIDKWLDGEKKCTLK